MRVQCDLAQCEPLGKLDIAATWLDSFMVIYSASSLFKRRRKIYKVSIMKRWIGRWIIGTSTLHTVFAFVVYSGIWLKIIHNGVFNTVKGNSEIGAPVLFLL